jgi:hypothetical protein
LFLIRSRFSLLGSLLHTAHLIDALRFEINDATLASRSIDAGAALRTPTDACAQRFSVDDMRLLSESQSHRLPSTVDERSLGLLAKGLRNSPLETGVEEIWSL